MSEYEETGDKLEEEGIRAVIYLAHLRGVETTKEQAREKWRAYNPKAKASVLDVYYWYMTDEEGNDEQ